MKTFARTLALTFVGGLLIWAVALTLGVTWVDMLHLGQPRNVLSDRGQEVRIPIPEGPAERQLPAVAVTTTGEYAFLFDDEDGPVRYDPCRPVDWVISPAGMPPGVESLVFDSVDRVSSATGLAFRFDGFTDETAAFDRPLFQDRYGARFAPVVVGFATQEQVPDLAGTVSGLGGSSAVYGAYGEQRFLRGGVVIMDADDLKRLVRSRGGTDIARAVIQHEFGHVVGLGHVGDANELMHDTNQALTDWGPGDRQGLAIAGAGPCETD